MAAVFLRLIGALLLSVTALLCGCTRLLFFPQRELLLTPEELSLPYQDLSIRSPDGTELHGWLLTAKNPRATIVHFHGNAENISTHLASVYWLPHQGFEVIMVDYRGFGRSHGSPNAEGARADIAATLAFAAARSARPLIVLGQSIGGSLAVPVIAEAPQRERIAAVVLDSSFASYRDIVREKLWEPWLLRPFAIPISWCFSDDAAPREHIAKISPIPVLLLHANKDPIVDRRHAETLYATAQAPKLIWIAPHQGHISSLHDPSIRRQLVEYLSAQLADYATSRPKNRGATLRKKR